MGTSSIYGGHKDNRGLLPDDYIPNTTDQKEGDESQILPDDANEPPIGTPWKSAKIALSKYINGSANSVSSVARQYGRACGGSSGLMRTSSSGITVGKRLSHFLGNASGSGLSSAFREYDIDLSNEDVYTALSKLADAISPAPNSNEDGIARNAVIASLATLFDMIETTGQDFDTLNNMDSAMQEIVITSYVSEYIWGRMMNDLEKSFLKYGDDSARAQFVEKEFKDYIHNIVEVKVNEITRSQTNGTVNIHPNVVEKLFRDCYEVLFDCSSAL